MPNTFSFLKINSRKGAKTCKKWASSNGKTASHIDSLIMLLPWMSSGPGPGPNIWFPELICLSWNSYKAAMFENQLVVLVLKIGHIYGLSNRKTKSGRKDNQINFGIIGPSKYFASLNCFERLFVKPPN